MSYRDLVEMMAERGVECSYYGASLGTALYPSHRALFELRREARVWRRVKVRTCPYLNNIVEQDHQAIKARARPMLGFKIFANATRAIAGIEFAHRIRKGQFMLIRKRGTKSPLSMRVVWNPALA